MPISEGSRGASESVRRAPARVRMLLPLLVAPTALGFAPPDTASSGRVVGGQFIHVVAPGESLTRIGARFGLSTSVLGANNGLSPGSRLSISQILRIDNRHIVPFFLDRGILINVPQRLLFLFEDGRLAAWYPVGLGRFDWQTMTGQFEIATKERSPTWHIPPSIQREMARQGEPIKAEVPPGPANPLGDYWMGLSGSGCGIHGTNAPPSVYAFRTHGCIRLHPDDIAELFSRVAVKTPVWIVYQPFLLARASDGAVFLEVNRDVYHRERDPQVVVEELAAREGVADAVDESLVAEVVASKEGVARRVDRQPAPASPRTRFRDLRRKLRQRARTGFISVADAFRTGIPAGPDRSASGFLTRDGLRDCSRKCLPTRKRIEPVLRGN